MKKISLKFLAIGAMLILGNVVAFAQEAPGLNDYVGATVKFGDQVGLVTYKVNAAAPLPNGAYPVTITGLDADGLDALAEARAGGAKVTLKIPVSFNEKYGTQRYNYAVTSIDDGLDGTVKQSFYGLTEVDTLIFEDPLGLNVNYTVGTKSFYGCTNLKKLKFTSTCTSIGTYAFQNCAIQSFEIPQRCATIGEYAFYNCKRLGTVTVEAGNTVMHVLGTHVFGNSSLTTLDLRNAEQLWQITGEPFMYNLSAINDVLKIVYLPTEVKAINLAFANCTALTNIYGFEKTSLGEAANWAWNKATPSVLTNRVDALCVAGQHILNGAFAGCRSLTRLDIPNCDVFVAPFVGCAALDTITFKAGYNKEIAKTPVPSTNLYGTFDDTDPAYSTKDQGALKVIEFKGAMAGIIQADAFVGSLGLAKVDFQGPLNGGTSIGAAFTDVTSLTEVVFNAENNNQGIVTAGGNVDILASAFQNTGIAALDFNGINLTAAASNFSIAANAFSNCAALADFKTGEIKVQNAGTFSIAGTAFTDNPLLENVTFEETKFTGAGTITIADNAFADGNIGLKNVEFKTIDSDANPTGYNSTVTIGAGARVFGDGLNLETVKFGDVNVAHFTIDDQAFAWHEDPGTLYALKNVEFGNIYSVRGINTDFTIDDKAFYEGKKEAKTVKFGSFSERINGANGTLTVLIDVNAFAADSLKTVEIGDITAVDVDINATAFQGKNLQKVKIGNIAPSTTGASDFDIAANAFQGGEVALKTVEIGTIGNLTGATIGVDAFAADKLQSVKIGNMAPTSLTIDQRAFSGGELTSVDLGNIGAGVTINDFAFANTNTTKAMTETVKIGNLAAATFGDVDADNQSNAFRGPQYAGSALNVTIKQISGAANMKSHTFEAPLAASGTASFTVTGNVTAALNVPAAPNNNVFIGAQKYELAIPVENTTDVWFQGNYNNDFAVADVFTNVNDLKIAVAATGTGSAQAKEYSVNGDLKPFQGAKTVTIGNIATGKSIVANTAGSTDEITSITFLKNVADANAIGTFNSPDIRKIEFANVAESGVKVAIGAVAANAFKAAADASLGLAPGENVTVIYREEQTRESEVIFDQRAFSTVDDAERPVTLYTSAWSKANTFEAADNESIDWFGTRAVWRLGFSESDVAPGEPIKATLSQKEGNIYAYAKVYIPKGSKMKYKIPAQYNAGADKDVIQMYFGRIDNSNDKIYMYSLPVIDDYYWIDATEVDQAFVMRVKTDIMTVDGDVISVEDGKNVVTATAVPADEEATMLADPEFYWFNAALSVQNQLRYNPAAIVNQELRNNAEFAGRDIYVMANPAKYGFGFTKFNKDATYTATNNPDREGEKMDLAKKSLYIVGKVKDPAKLTVVFEGDEDWDNETAIQLLQDAVSDSANTNDAIYNLQGQRITAPQKGQIYIQSGKKIFVQ